MSETNNGSENNEGDLSLSQKSFLLVSLLTVISIPIFISMSGSPSKSDKISNSSSSKQIEDEVTEESVRRKIVGTYEHASGGKLIVRNDGECYIHLQEPDQECQYDIYVTARERVEFDVEMLSRDMPGTGGALDGEYRDGDILLEALGETFVYEKVR